MLFPRVASAALFTTTTLALALTSCIAAVEPDAADPELSEPVESAALGLSSSLPPTSGCSTARKTKLTDAYNFLRAEVGTYKDKFKACLSSATFLEHKGDSVTTIFNNFTNTTVAQISCVNDDVDCSGEERAIACASPSTKEIWVKKSTIDDLSTRELASHLAHEFMHLQGYLHAVNVFPENLFEDPLYYFNTVPEQVERCVLAAGSEHTGERKPNPFMGPGEGPTMAGIVGAHSYNSCNCVYLSEGYATCGASDYLSKYTDSYKLYTLPSGYTPANVVGMAQVGEWVCAYFDDGNAGCGTQSGCRPVTSFDDSFFDYGSLPISPKSGKRYKPTDIAGIAGDDNNGNIVVWFKEGYATVGTWDDLDGTPYRFTIAPEHGASSMVEMLADGDFNCVLYTDKKVSCGTSNDLDSKRSIYATKFY